MRLSVLLIITVLFAACEMDEIVPTTTYDCRSEIAENPVHPRETQFEELLQKIVSQGPPGMQLSITDEHGLWNAAFGYADLASKVEIQPCNITRVGSTVKTFTAVTILQLAEEGELSLDDPITKHLSNSTIEGLENADKSTIEMLVKHSSGIFNYIQSAQFQTASLNDLTRVWQPNELLHYARGKEAYFEPGTDVLYSNTGYILLGMIIEKVTGKPFYEAFEERIFEPLGMVFTQFAAEDPVPDDLIRGYVDFYSNLNLINSTYYSGWDYYTADGGLISNANDLNIFVTALFRGELLSEESMTKMLDWQKPKAHASDGWYGLGTFRIKTDQGPAYIHSGDAIGYFASMVYFPDHDVTITWAVNGNYGKVDEATQTKEAMEKIFKTVIGE